MREPDVCWHCHSVLIPEPAPHCEQCPPVGECDAVGCDEPGCAAPVVSPDACELQRQLVRAQRLLLRVIDDGIDSASLARLARDIAAELARTGALDEPAPSN